MNSRIPANYSPAYKDGNIPRWLCKEQAAITADGSLWIVTKMCVQVSMNLVALNRHTKEDEGVIWSGVKSSRPFLLCPFILRATFLPSKKFDPSRRLITFHLIRLVVNYSTFDARAGYGETKTNTTLRIIWTKEKYRCAIYRRRGRRLITRLCPKISPVIYAPQLSEWREVP